jgi:hypothetical protein
MDPTSAQVSMVLQASIHQQESAYCEHVMRGASITSPNTETPEYFLPGSFGVYDSIADLTAGRGAICDTDKEGDRRGGGS